MGMAGGVGYVQPQCLLAVPVQCSVFPWVWDIALPCKCSRRWSRSALQLNSSQWLGDEYECDSHGSAKKFGGSSFGSAGKMQGRHALWSRCGGAAPLAMQYQ